MPVRRLQDGYRFAWSAACIGLTAIFVALAASAWAAGDGPGNDVAQPAFELFAIAGLVSLYFTFAPLLHLPPFTDESQANVPSAQDRVALVQKATEAAMSGHVTIDGGTPSGPTPHTRSRGVLTYNASGARAIAAELRRQAHGPAPRSYQAIGQLVDPKLTPAGEALWRNDLLAAAARFEREADEMDAEQAAEEG